MLVDRWRRVVPSMRRAPPRSGETEFVWRRWSRSNRARSGTNASSTKTPPSARWAAALAKQRSWSSCAAQAEEGVEGDEDSENAPSTADVGEVADRHGDARRRRASRGASRPSPRRRRCRAPRGRAPRAGARAGRCRSRARAPARRRRARRASRRAPSVSSPISLVECVVDVRDPVAVGLGPVAPPWCERYLARSASMFCCEALREAPVVVRAGTSWSPGVAASSTHRLDVVADSRSIASGPAGGPWPGTTCSGSSAARRSRNGEPVLGREAAREVQVRSRRRRGRRRRARARRGTRRSSRWRCGRRRSSIAIAPPSSRSPVKVSVGKASSRPGTRRRSAVPARAPTRVRPAPRARRGTSPSPPSSRDPAGPDLGDRLRGRSVARIGRSAKACAPP